MKQENKYGITQDELTELESLREEYDLLFKLDPGDNFNELLNKWITKAECLTPLLLKTHNRFQANVFSLLHVIYIRKDISNENIIRLKSIMDQIQEYYYVGKYRFSFDMFDPINNKWSLFLCGLMGKPDLSFLEIGSAEGASAVWLLDNVLTHKKSKLTCIDPFDWKGQSDAIQNRIYGRLNSDTLEYTFDCNIKSSGASSRVNKIKGFSQIELRKLQLNSFDFIYIDGAHTSAAVMADAVMSWDLLKHNGLMTFDDYLWEPGADNWETPKLAIDRFIEIYGRYLEVIVHDYQVTIRKIGDFFDDQGR